VVISVCTAAICSCTRYAAPGSREAVEDSRTSKESRYNLMGFPGDDQVVTAEVPAADDTAREASDEFSFPDYENKDSQASEVFSVQLFASKSSEETERFRLEVESLFGEKVKIDYKAPYYKVRVGEKSTLEEGEILLERVKGLGFPNAWLIRIRL